MADSDSFIQFPMPSSGTLALVALGLFALIAAAIGTELYRRAARRKVKLADEWRFVEDIFEDKKLSDGECALVRSMIKRHAAANPLRAMTVRHEFDRCVEAAMIEADKQGADKRFAELGSQLRGIRIGLGLDYVPLGQQIYSTRELHEGQWMAVTRETESAPKWGRMMIDDVDEAYFYVSRHGKGGDELPDLKAGDAVKCRLWRDDDGRYIFSTSIAGAEDGPAAWIFHHTSHVTRTQAREHFRVRHDQPTTVGVLDAIADAADADLAKLRTASKMRGRVTSLSAGGCALVLQQSVPEHSLLRIQVETGEGELMGAEAKIVAVAPISGGRFLLRATFVGLDDDRRDRIAKYVLHRQQQMIAAREEMKP